MTRTALALSSLVALGASVAGAPGALALTPPQAPPPQAAAPSIPGARDGNPEGRPVQGGPGTRIANGGIAYRNAQNGEITLFNYGVSRTADSTVFMEITDLGELPGGSLQDAARAPGLPATPRGTIRIPVLALRQLMSTAENHEGVPSAPARLGVEMGVENNRVVFGIRRTLGIPLALTLAALLLLLGLVVYLSFQTRKARRSARVLADGQRVAIASREAERVRIAREIHDGPVQRIAAIALTIGSDLQSPTVADELRELTRELRGMADGLRPPSLGRYGIGAAVEALAARVEQENPDMTVLAQVDGALKGERFMSEEDEVNLYRIVQEAVNNAVEHSNPSLLVIRIECKGGVVLEVIDDGDGFTWPDDLGALREAGHFGLVGIAERAELLSAKVDVSEGRAGGTHFTVTVPKGRIRIPADV